MTPAVIESGCIVKFHYHMVTQSQRHLRHIEKEDDVEYLHGSGELVAGLEEALDGMREGERRAIVLDPPKAFGDIDPGAFVEVPREGIPEFLNPQVGQYVTGERDGDPFRAEIVAVSGETVILDLNHPLAGRTLKFEVEVLNVLSPRAAGIEP